VSPLGTALWSALILAVGAAGGGFAFWVGLPMPWLLGALITCGLWVSVLPPAYRPPVDMPRIVRAPFIAAVGVMIGATFTMEVLQTLPQWWSSLLIALIFTLCAQVMGYLIVRRMFDVSPASAWFASTPGGLMESVVMGTQAGGSERFIATVQFLRLIVIVTVVPIGYTLANGQQVGSAAGVSLGSAEALSSASAMWLLGSGLVGMLAGLWAGKQIIVLIAPMFLSALVHLLGWAEGTVPWPIVVAAQIVIGSALGLTFRGFTLMMLGQALKGCSVLISALLALALAFAGLASLISPAPVHLLFLSFVPAGIIEMSLIALTLDTDPVFVTTHHLLRIMVALLVTPLVFRVVFAARKSDA